MQLTMLDFSMPTLNSIFPFLETVRPRCDPCWHIRRGQLLHHYVSVWAVCNDKNQSNSIIFDEAQFKTVEICDKSGGNAIFINKATKQTTTPHVITSQRDQAVTHFFHDLSRFLHSLL
jgi:hypothetical protein